MTTTDTTPTVYLYTCNAVRVAAEKIGKLHAQADIAALKGADTDEAFDSPVGYKTGSDCPLVDLADEDVTFDDPSLYDEAKDLIVEAYRAECDRLLNA